MAKYVNNRKLYYETIVSKALGKPTADLNHMLMLMAVNSMKKFTYYNEDDYNDCYGEAVIHILKNWHMFDPTKSDNPFAYFTEIIKRGATAGLNIIYKQKGLEVKAKILSLDATFQNTDGKVGNYL